jgi:serpin B
MARRQVCFCAFVLALASCQGERPAAPPGSTGGTKIDAPALVRANTHFALDLYSRLRDEERNLFFSPFSIHTALAMTYAGARGETAKEIAGTLHWGTKAERLRPQFAALLQTKEKDGYELSLANSLWGQKDFGFLPEFVSLVQEEYGGDLKEVDFANGAEEARRTINGWVADKTKQKIKGVLKPRSVDADVCLILVNTMYLKASWALPFKKSSTRAVPFYVSADKSFAAPMMHQKAHFRYLQEGGFEVLELPYENGELSMVILLPEQVDGLRALEKRLSATLLTKALEGLRFREVRVTLPKFRVVADIDLNRSLKEQGLRRAFIPGEADFSGMTATAKKLWIREVVHKAFVSVDEAGTEAAAATAVPEEKSKERRLPPTPAFVADHPFLFLIRDTRSENILFLGRLVDPRQTSTQMPP